MKLIAPDYYASFSCIGSECKHNCCIGWEIDVDDFSFSYYKSLTGNLGEKLKENIFVDDFGAHFVLDHNNRCPFLTSDGLCEIINEIGEVALCDICADHPRFRNSYSNHTEIGIGLSCEEAARIILTNENPVGFITLDNVYKNNKPDKKENEFLSEREFLFSQMQNNKMTFSQKISFLYEQYKLKPFENISQFANDYLKFEHLTKEWPKLLENLASDGITANKILQNIRSEKPFENLLHYFIFRHLKPSLNYDERCATVGAAILSVFIIASVFLQNSDPSIESLIDISRLYSSEIEYSDVNMKLLVDVVKEFNYVC